MPGRNKLAVAITAMSIAALGGGIAEAEAVPPPRPIAAFTDTTGPWFNSCDFVAIFNASGSVAPAGTSITQYAWNFGNGNSLVTTSPRASQFYPTGSYDVTLTVTDSAGATASTSRVIRGVGGNPRCR